MLKVCGYTDSPKTARKMTDIVTLLAVLTMVACVRASAPAHVSLHFAGVQRAFIDWTGHATVVVPNTGSTQVGVCIMDPVVSGCTGKNPPSELTGRAAGWDAVSRDCTGYRWIYSRRGNVLLPPYIHIIQGVRQRRCAFITYDANEVTAENVNQKVVLDLQFGVETLQYVIPKQWTRRVMSMYTVYKRFARNSVPFKVFANDLLYKTCIKAPKLQRDIAITHCRKNVRITLKPLKPPDVDRGKRVAAYITTTFMSVSALAGTIFVMSKKVTH